jgi:dipeptidyl aminopeptidase/acylaminoacyl peptidase
MSQLRCRCGIAAAFLLLVLLPCGLAAAEPQPPTSPPAASAAAPAPADEITLEKIMADPEWIGNPPVNPYWADDGRAVYFERERQGADGILDLFRLELETGAVRRIEDRERGQIDVAGGDFSEDRTRKVYSREGDVYLKDLSTGAILQLTRTAEREGEPRFLVGDRRVAYRRGDTFLARDLDSGVEWQVADLQLAKDPAEADEEETFLDRDQERHFAVIRQREREEEAIRDRAREQQRADPTRPPLPWYLGEGVEIERSFLSPTAEWLVMALLPKERDQGKRDAMPVFVTESGYVDVEEVRPKVGTGKPVSPTLVLLDLVKHERHDLDLGVLPGIKDDPLRELREKAQREREEAEKAEKAAKDAKRKAQEKEEKAEEEKEQEEKQLQVEKGTETEAVKSEARGGEAAKTGGAGTRAAEGEKADEKDEKPAGRPVELHEVVWSDDGKLAVVQLFSWDNKDRWIAQIDVGGKKLVPLERISDRAWVNDWQFDELGWLPDNRTLWYLSEESGWSQLYLRPVPEGPKRRLTGGDFEVSDVTLSHDGRSFYVSANREHPGVYEAYRVAVDGGAMERLTQLGGVTEWVLSPDERSLLLSSSTITHPPELHVQAADPGAAARRLTDTTSAEFAAIRWTAAEIVPIPSSHVARPIYSRVYLPADWSADRTWPAVVFVHGAGYLQNAHKGWSSYFREFMFHSLLTRSGYVVLDMDYRASAGYGRDWRTAIYRQMGHPELEDLEDGVAWLVANRAVDAKRVGVYGGSYGGFMTFMALFRRPELFAAGAALRPVTDWAHYNQGYTSNILNTPDVDPEAYRKSSPIEYAEGLAKPLLICHGMVDDNVLFMDSVRLVQRLIELGKQDFETAIYPVEAHAFQEPSSWLDEYRRVYELMEANLK